MNKIKNIIENKEIFLLFLLITLILFVGLSVLFFTMPMLDIAAAHLFYQSGKFMMANNAIGDFFANTLDTVTKMIFYALIPLYAINIIFKKSYFGINHRQFWFVAGTVLIATLLVTNVILKDHWGRARPHQITEFGGAKTFTPAWAITDQCQKNCSFVSGHTSLGFATLALALVATSSLKRRNLRPVYVSLSLVFGTVVGLQRMMRGAHFLSDTVLAALITIIICLVLFMALKPDRGP